MGEEMNPRETKRGPSVEEIQEINRLAEEGKLEPEKGLVPISKEAKTAIAVVVGLGCVSCTGATIWELTHQRPAIVEPASATQIPPTPEVVVPRERTSEEPQVDIPSTEIPQEWQSLIGKEVKEEVKEPIIYTVKEDDTLTKIAKEHGNIPWEIIYNMNREVIGEDPNKLKPGMELLIIHWGPVEASCDFVYKKIYETQERGEEPTWIYFTLNREATAQEVAGFFGIEAQSLAGLNEIDEPARILPKEYHLMIPIGEGFAFTKADRETGRKWIPKPGFFLGAIWWENPTGEATPGPWWPNEAYILEPYAKEYWIEATWSTADQLPPEDFVPEVVTDIPANRTWEITDEQGNVRHEERKGFLVYGKKRIIHTEYRRVEAGEWIVPKHTV